MTGFERNRLDSSLVVQTPEGIEFVLYPAGLPIRACALGIDMCAQWLILLLLVILNALLNLQNTDPGSSGAGGMWLIFLLRFCVDWFYYVFCEVFFRGQSLGKRIMGIRVVRGDGSPVNPGASFLRNLLRFADTFHFLYLIVFLSMTASRGFRRLGDWAADTLVVYTSQAQALIRGSAPPVSGFPPPVNPPRRLSYDEKQGILMFARRYPLLGKARADEIAREYAARLRGDGGEGSGAAYLLGIAGFLAGDAGTEAES